MGVSIDARFVCFIYASSNQWSTKKHIYCLASYDHYKLVAVTHFGDTAEGFTFTFDSSYERVFLRSCLKMLKK